MFVRLFWRPLIAAWLRFSMFSWRRMPVPQDSRQVHSRGADPDRILLAGDGAATGRGVRTHDLGLPGYLARSLTAITGRATDVDIVVERDMTAALCLEAISTVELSRFDGVLLSLGSVEAITFTSVSRWERDLGAVLDHIEESAPAATTTFVLAILPFSSHVTFPASYARAADRQVTRLNAATARVLTGRPQVHQVVAGGVESIELSGAHAYERWAASVAPQIDAVLATRRDLDRRVEVRDEARRQASLDALGATDISDDAVLARLTSQARSVFGTEIAAITLIDGPRQTMLSVDGMRADDMARQESFCDVTIRRADHLAVEDASLDSRYADLRIVRAGPKVRFYAGYPVESPDGERIGAFCVLDSSPRSFSLEDAALLRLLALETQARIWEIRGESASSRQAEAAPAAPVIAVIWPLPRPSRPTP